MKGSLIIISFFILGIMLGLYDLLPESVQNSKLSFYALIGLMFCVGVSVGNDPNMLSPVYSLPNIKVPNWVPLPYYRTYPVKSSRYYALRSWPAISGNSHLYQSGVLPPWIPRYRLSYSIQEKTTP